MEIIGNHFLFECILQSKKYFAIATILQLKFFRNNVIEHY